MSEQGNRGEGGLRLGEGGFGFGGPRHCCSSRWVVLRCGQGVQRGEQGSGLWDEAVIEVHHSEEPLQLLLRLRQWEVVDGGYPVLEWLDDASGSDLVSQERDGVLTEGALRWVEEHAVGGEPFEDHAEVTEVFLHAGAGDEDVVDIAEDEVESTENVVHEPLECLGAVPEAVGHP